jgi:hypothetical protein
MLLALEDAAPRHRHLIGRPMQPPDDSPAEDPRRFVPPGFAEALTPALHRTLPAGAAGSFAVWAGRERVGINFREVADQQRVIDAVSEALRELEAGFAYLPSIDISIWKP